jgi:hypothetical protein
MGKSITLRAILISHYLEGQNASKSGKSIMKCLIIYRFVQFLMEMSPTSDFSEGYL